MRRGGAAAALSGAWLLASTLAWAQPNERDIEVSPTSLKFGPVCIEASSAPKTVTIQNVSQGSGQEATLQVSSIEPSSGKDAADFRRSPVAFPLEIEHGRSASFTVTFAPGAWGPRDGRFTITSDDPDEREVDVSVEGIGLDRRIVTDAAVSFGEQRVGTRSPSKTLTIRNPGQDATRVTSVRSTGANAADFVLAVPAQPFQILAGGFRAVPVAFQPSGPGLRRASIEITSNACNAATLRVSLVGTGVLPNVDVQPNPIDAGTSPLGTRSRPTAITVSNGGQAALEIMAVQILGPDAADFALSGLPPMPKTLQPEESFVFSLRMTPSMQGLRIATLNVLSDDPDAPTFSVEIRGMASPASPSPAASASPTPTASPAATPTADESLRALGPTPNDALAVGLVVGGVLSAFAGLGVVRRLVRAPEDEDEGF